MSDSHSAHYTLASDGGIRHWLTRGAHTTPLIDLERIISPSDDPFLPNGRAWITNAPYSLHLKKLIYDRLPASLRGWTPGQTPVHLAKTELGMWQYRSLHDDNTVDFNRFNFTPAYMQGWAYTQLHVSAAMRTSARLLHLGLTKVFLNGGIIHETTDQVGYVHPLHTNIMLDLNAGENELYLYAGMVGWREARIALGIRFYQPLPVSVSVPIGMSAPEQWHSAENALDHVIVRQFAFPTLPGKLELSQDATAPFDLAAALTMPSPELVVQRPTGLQLPIGEVRAILPPGQSAELPITPALLQAMSSLPGENHLELTLRPANGTPLETQRALWASAQPFSAARYGDYDMRKREALDHVARMPFDVMGTLCAVTLGRKPFLDATAIAIACQFMEERRDCADFYAVSLMALMHRFGSTESLRESDRRRIERTFRTFKYWIEEPGIDAMCYFTENHQILFHVTAYLAAQYWNDWTFENADQPANTLKSRARADIEAWIERRLRGSFSEWDSNAYMALDAFALLVLNEYGDDAALNQMATDLLHKIFFMIACQSFKGAHGSTHGRCYVAALKSSRFENTSSLQRIAWGMGIFNGETRATGMLALAQKYRVPDVIQRIGAHLPDLLITQARAKGDYRLRHDLREDGWDARTITRRTPDYLLSACVDHRLNEIGIQEHLWQATFSPEAVIFTNYPGNSQEHGNARPNFWAGSVRLPRVAMHERTIICLYPLQDDIGLGFSHAYFPTAHFDEWRLHDQWAFARVGNAYAALWGDGALLLTTRGVHAYQEIRSGSSGHAWVFHVGSGLEDGAFADFCAAVSASQPTITRGELVPTVACHGVGGTRLRLGEHGGLFVDEQEHTSDDFPHYDNLYTHTLMGAHTMTIEHDGLSLTISL